MVIIDRTAATAGTHQTRDGRNIFSRGNPHARRSTARVDAVILHQTTFVSGDLARYDHVIANYAVLRDGRVLRLRDVAAALNSVGTDHRAIDVEFEGLYRSGSGVVPPAAQLHAGRALVRHLRERHGVTRIFAHAHFTAKDCPGAHLWYNVGEWGVAEGLLCDRAERPIPRAWRDPLLAAECGVAPSVVDPWTGATTSDIVDPWGA
jgi:hypothetical protein